MGVNVVGDARAGRSWGPPQHHSPKRPGPGRDGPAGGRRPRAALPTTYLLDALWGAAAALGFPFVVSAAGPTPLLDWAPRELLILLAPFAVARITLAPIGLGAACRRAWAVGLGFFGLLLHWLVVTMASFGGLSLPLSLLFLALLVAFCAAFIALLPWAARRLMQRGWPLPWALAAAVVVFEWLRGDGAGFPWGAWGYAVSRHLPLAHLAQLGGVPLISAWLTAVGALGASLVADAGAGTTTRAPAAAGGAPALGEGLRAGGGAVGRRQLLAVSTALAVLWGVGLALSRRPMVCTPGPRVALVQGNIAQSVKNQPIGHAQEVMEVHQQLSRAAVAAGAELLVWPETSVPGWIDTRRPWPPAWRMSVPAILGVTARDATGHYFNSAIWAEPDGSILGRYDKHHLVPFGEYVPLRGILPIDRLVPGTIDITPGQADVTLGPKRQWGPLICYDGVFAQYSRRQAAAGATVLTNLTNDAWYGVTGAPYQHRDFYIMRAIETGRWVARATNTGVSLFIDPYGRQHGATQLGQRTFALGRPELCAGATFYQVAGDWVLAVAAVALLASFLPRPQAGKKKRAMTRL